MSPPIPSLIMGSNILSNIKQCYEIYRKEGVKSLYRRVTNHFGIVLRRNTIMPIENMFWDLKGKQHFEIAETSAEFDATEAHGGDIVRGHFESEYDILKSFVSNLQPDDVVFDVGGHLGLYTCFAANKVVDGDVITYEPFPPNLVHIIENISRNDGSNVRVIGGALADIDDFIPIQSPTMTENYGSPAIGNTDSDGNLMMASFEGDGLVERGTVPGPSVVKIDVEGAEGLVIDGLSESLAADECRRIYCELHPPAPHRPDVTDYDDTIPGIIDRIEELGFTIKTRHERGSDLHVIGVKE